MKLADLKKLAQATVNSEVSEFERRIYEVHGTNPLPRTVSVPGDMLLAMIECIEAADAMRMVLNEELAPMKIAAFDAAREEVK